MMLDDYDLHAMVLAEGSAHLQVPSNHPAFAELEKGHIKPVGGIRNQSAGGIRPQDWIYLFRIKDWNRLAAQQRADERLITPRIQPVRVSPIGERKVEEAVGA